MKIAHFELIIELEEVLEKKLKSIFGSDYSLFLNLEGDSINLIENGQIDYASIEIYIDGIKYSMNENSERFWDIIHKLEEDEKINQMYHNLEIDLKHSSPQLFEQEIEFPKTYRSISEYIVTFVFLTIFGVILFLLMYF